MKNFALILTICLPLLTRASELPEWHMKPLGSHIKPDPVDETFADNLISPEEFAQKYVLPRKPIVFRNVVKTWPAYKLWTDEYLKEHYGDMEMRLEGKKEKGTSMPKGDICLGRDHLRTFIDEHKQGADKYVVSDLPFPMWHEVNILPSMSCGDFLTSFVEIDIWMNSDMGVKGNGGNSLLHKDAFNTVNCVVNGTKDWKLIELKYNDYVYQSWEGPMDAGYGGFSVLNVDKINAKTFPNVGKIPRWQFVTVNAGDCLHLPSQMWHQVRSYGETNRAVAFLFTQFNEKKSINTTNCPKKPVAMSLSEVDVDWPYSGTGLMPMGNSELESLPQDLKILVNKTVGYITKRRTYRLVYMGHESGAKNKELMLQKARYLYAYLLDLAGGEKEKMTLDFIRDLTRPQLRDIYIWLHPNEPANTYEHEYSVYLPEEIKGMMRRLQMKNNGLLKKNEFIEAYTQVGTLKFAEDIWNRLAGDQQEITDISKTIDHALHHYEKYRRNDPELLDSDEDATITTPQGHVSQPKKVKGGYNANDEEEKEEDPEENEAESQNDEQEPMNKDEL